MRSRLSSDLIVTFLVLVGTLSLMIYPVAVGCGACNVNEVISKLKALRNDDLQLPDFAFQEFCSASFHRRILANKIEAVTHMVEVGAYNGAVNNLENYIKKLVEYYLINNYCKRLIEKIDELIYLLKKLESPCPPCLQNFVVTAYPNFLTVEQGGTNSTTIMVISLGRFDRLVDLIVVTSSPIPGVIINLNPTQLALDKDDYAASTLTVTAIKNASIGTYPITIKAVSENLEHSFQILLTITSSPSPPAAFDFRITANPLLLKVQQGTSNVSVIVIKSLTSQSQPVDLTVTSKSINSVITVLNPSQVISPLNNYSISLLTVQADANALVGDYVITLTGTSGVLKRILNITLEVTAPPIKPTPDFIVVVFPPSISIKAGASNTLTIVVASLKDFNQSSSINATCEPSQGITLSLEPCEIAYHPINFKAFTLMIEVDSAASIGEYEITVTGTSGNLRHNIFIKLNVTAPSISPFQDFSIVASPNYLAVKQGEQGITSIIMTSLEGFNRSIHLKTTSIAGVNFAFDTMNFTPPPNGMASSTLIASVCTTAVPGKYEIIITGTNNDLKHDTKIFFEVVAEKEQPEIAGLLQLPENPAYNDSVTILALVTDLESGIRDVVLNYTNGIEWISVTMVLEEGLYCAKIPAFSCSTIVKYYIYASDRAGNLALSGLKLYTVSDSYAPLIGNPAWMPRKPDPKADITVEVNVTEPIGSSGVQNVTLWIKSKNLDWRAFPMTFANGTWMVKLLNQSDAIINFKIQAYDYAGNSAETKLQQFEFETNINLLLPLILLIIIIVAALTGSIIYVLWHLWHKQKNVGDALKPTPLSSMSKVQQPVLPIKGYEMASFIVPTRNAGNTISQRIARAYEHAIKHVGPSEIIVVDDGSLDNTYEMACLAVESNRRKWPNIPAKVIKLSSVLGDEETIQICRNKAMGEIMVIVDGETFETPS